MSFWNANIQKMQFKPKESDVFMAKFKNGHHKKTGTDVCCNSLPATHEWSGHDFGKHQQPMKMPLKTRAFPKDGLSGGNRPSFTL